MWTYDDAGNIMSRKEYAYTTGNVGSVQDTVSYVYGNSTWGDLLTKFDGKTVSSDAIGNITSISGYRTYTWKHGRQLASSSGVGGNWTYSYNADGMRYKRTSGNAAYTYYYNGDLLRYVDYDSNTTDSKAAAKLYFVLDASGKPIEVSYRPEGSTTTSFYYYVHNLQGDVEALVDSSNGVPVVWYTYDAWGNVLSIGGNLASTLGKLNPFRYRSYVYDEESKLYYLQSRYYDPEMGRFICADVLVSTGQGILSNNMFAYCFNNPVNMRDNAGTYPIYIVIHKKTEEMGDDNYRTTINYAVIDSENPYGYMFAIEETVTYTYTIVNGIIQLFNVNNDTLLLLEPNISRVLASEMIKRAQCISSNALAGRSIRGVAFELSVHAGLYHMHILRKNAEPIDMGAVPEGSYGYDYNAAWFENPIGSIGAIIKKVWQIVRE